MPPVIRDARPSDDIAPLLHESSPMSYDVYFGGPERALRKLRAICRRPGHIAGWDVCVVAADGARLVGVLAGCPGAECVSLTRRTDVLAFGDSAPWRWPRMVRLLRQDSNLLDPPPGSWYVDAFAVDPGHRRRGVGRALLAEAERRAREAGYSALALDTAVGNVAARALYESAGMIAGAPVPGDERQDAAGGYWVPYVKTL